ncbi:MAG: nicotinamide mononucleotide transporter [Bacteroidales bacterium]|nr:nicotinamide mononucleotide transporter [Bacteroidales bacterium]
MKNKGFNFFFNLFILVGMVTAVIIVNVMKLSDPDVNLWKQIIFTVGAVMGVFNTVLSANGNIWTFFFGILDVTICAFTNLDSGNMGQFLQHMLYFLPMQFVGIWQWRKRGADSKQKVKARRLTPRGLLFVGLGIVLGTAAVFGLLYWIDSERFAAGKIPEMDSAKIFFDSAVVTLNIIGQIMLALAFAEQWYVWTLVNIFSICLWTNRLMSSSVESYTVVMLIKYCFYLLNSLNGIRIWMELSKDGGELPHRGHTCC